MSVTTDTGTRNLQLNSLNQRKVPPVHQVIVNLTSWGLHLTFWMAIIVALIAWFY